MTKSKDYLDRKSKELQIEIIDLMICKKEHLMMKHIIAAMEDEEALLVRSAVKSLVKQAILFRSHLSGKWIYEIGSKEDAYKYGWELENALYGITHRDYQNTRVCQEIHQKSTTRRWWV